jgi:hypothetical protein
VNRKLVLRNKWAARRVPRVPESGASEDIASIK